MNRKNLTFTLGIVLLLAATLHAQSRPAAQGNLPPGNAMALSVHQARAALKEAIKNKFVGTAKWCNLALGCDTYALSPVTDFRLSSRGFSLAAPYIENATPFDGKISVDFEEKYVQAFEGSYGCPTSHCYFIGYLPKPSKHSMDGRAVIFVWSDGAAAQRFADAFNRLAYAAAHPQGQEDFAAFSVAARAWRENPARPSLSAEADRHRILAENAIQEKDFDRAINEYEAGLAIFPTWPAGQFNLALLSGETGDYDMAVMHMQEYLALVPDAPDAQSAKDKIVVWQDKIAHP